MKYLLLLLLVAGTAFADSPYLQSHDGKYLGDYNASRYSPNSISNPYGEYGNRYSPESVNNRFGRYGSPYSSESIRYPYPSEQSPKLFSDD